jgi:hypothetical protein
MSKMGIRVGLGVTVAVGGIGVKVGVAVDDGALVATGCVGVKRAGESGMVVLVSVGTAMVGVSLGGTGVPVSVDEGTASVGVLLGGRATGAPPPSIGAGGPETGTGGT